MFSWGVGRGVRVGGWRGVELRRGVSVRGMMGRGGWRVGTYDFGAGVLPSSLRWVDRYRAWFSLALSAPCIVELLSPRSSAVPAWPTCFGPVRIFSSASKALILS